MPIVDLILRRYQETHKAALSLVEDLTEERFHWGPNRGLQSIAWQLWHIARWDDFLGEVLIGRPLRWLRDAGRPRSGPSRTSPNVGGSDQPSWAWRKPAPTYAMRRRPPYGCQGREM